MTAQQPHNNVVRVALQTLAATLGGTQSLHTNSFDEAYALPSQRAVTIALRTQQIVAYESGVADSVDPLGGSYCIEALTDQIEEEATHYIAEIDRQGGAVIAIENGYLQREITESAYKYQKEVEKGTRTVVGVNEFRSDEGAPVKTLRVNPAVENKVVDRLKLVKKKRDRQKVKDALEKLRVTADSEKENLVPSILKAVKAYATVGEICNTLREAYGEHRALTLF